jgi:hypothetical protein
MSMQAPDVQRAPTKPPSIEGPKPPSRARGRSLWIVAVIVAVVAGAAFGIWAITRDGGPVAAEDAQIEVTFTGDGTSYSGDREIVEGTARITLINESTELLEFGVVRIDPGSQELPADLAELLEPTFFVDWDAAEVLAVWEDIPTGSETWTLELRPGIYLLELSYSSESAQTSRTYRAGVIEVVAG